jgi:excisionase family DNA binding protein
MTRWRDRIVDPVRELLEGTIREVAGELLEERLAAFLGERFLTIDEAAEELRMHPQTLYDRVRNRGAPHWRFSGPRGTIRVRLTELRRWSADLPPEDDEHDR